MEEPPFVAVEVIEQWSNTGIIKPIVSQPLRYMGPVLLLNMGIVVFMVRPASGKRNRLCPLSEVPHEVVVEKL